MQPVSPRVVELLNDALTFELTVTNTYFLNARMLDAWGLGQARQGLLRPVHRRDARRRRPHPADPALRRPPQPAAPGRRSGSARPPRRCCVLALDSEKAAVAQFNASAQECHDLGDHGTAAVFEEMVRDEEKHADWFESQLDAIERVGLPQYLAQQIPAGEGPA